MADRRFRVGETSTHGHAHLNIACVRPDNRRQGVASALVAEFAARALAAGSEHVTLDVDVTNEVGQMAWQRLGFTEYSKRLVAPAEALESKAGAAEPRRVHARRSRIEQTTAAVGRPRPSTCRGSAAARRA
jgi:ribosomal protein S18 acetylase RimI-like enzyme